MPKGGEVSYEPGMGPKGAVLVDALGCEVSSELGVGPKGADLVDALGREVSCEPGMGPKGAVVGECDAIGEKKFHE